MTILGRLRAVTGEMHSQVEATPYSRALAMGEAVLESYVGHLRAMAVVHAALERHVNQATDARLASVWDPNGQVSAELQKDLRYFQTQGVPDIPDAVAAALRVAKNIRLRSLNRPISLLGYLYVMEGSAKGASDVLRFVEEGLELSDQGTRYLAAQKNALPTRWSQFASRLENIPLEEQDQQQVCDAAFELYRELLNVFSSLHPVEKSTLRPLATSLNPEAGMHAIPSDPRELAAAARAGERCWREFPYFERRYGERGKRFTSSDSAWLVTLTACEESIVFQQVLWLGRVLAPRGIPRYLLECQLHLLHDELLSSVPENAARYGKLKAAAQVLERARYARVSKERFNRLSEEFDQRMAALGEASLRHAGPVLVAAIADELDGLTGAAESVVSWLTDPQIFPAENTKAVEATLREAGL